jgi:phosphatidylserine decarboxylase
VEREAYIAFLLSMMTQVDELNKARHYQMSFYEFLEALARVAEKVSILPFDLKCSNPPKINLD